MKPYKVYVRFQDSNILWDCYVFAYSQIEALQKGMTAFKCCDIVFQIQSVEARQLTL